MTWMVRSVWWWITWTLHTCDKAPTAESPWKAKSPPGGLSHWHQFTFSQHNILQTRNKIAQALSEVDWAKLSPSTVRYSCKKHFNILNVIVYNLLYILVWNIPSTVRGTKRIKIRCIYNRAKHHACSNKQDRISHPIHWRLHQVGVFRPMLRSSLPTSGKVYVRPLGEMSSTSTKIGRKVMFSSRIRRNPIDTLELDFRCTVPRGRALNSPNSCIWCSHIVFFTLTSCSNAKSSSRHNQPAITCVEVSGLDFPERTFTSVHIHIEL